MDSQHRNDHGDAVRRLTSRDLAKLVPGTSPRWWERMLPRLRRAGVLSKVGAHHFGDAADVLAWLRSGGGEDAEDHGVAMTMADHRAIGSGR